MLYQLIVGMTYAGILYWRFDHAVLIGDFPVFASGDNVGSVTVSRSGLMTVFDSTCRHRSREVLRLAAACGGNYVALGVMMPVEGDNTFWMKRSFTKYALDALGFDEPVSFHLIRAGDVYDSTAAGAVTEAAAPVPDPADTMPEQEAGENDDAPESLPPPITQEPEKEKAPYAAPEPPHPEPSEPEETALIDGWTHVDTPGMFFSDLSVAEACANVAGALITARDGFELLAVPISPEEPFPLMPVFCFGSSGVIGGREYIVFKIKDGNLTL